MFDRKAENYRQPVKRIQSPATAPCALEPLVPRMIRALESQPLRPRYDNADTAAGHLLNLTILKFSKVVQGTRWKLG